MFKICKKSGIRIWTILFISAFPYLNYASVDSLKISTLRDAEKIRFKNPDSAIYKMQSFYEACMERKDTLKAIKTLASLSNVHGNIGKYRESYDDLWKALILADQAQSDSNKVYLKQRIGRFYAYYKRQQKAIDMINEALSLNKRLVDGGKMERFSLAHRYFALSSSYQEFGEFHLAQAYLDSCFLFYDEGKRRSLRRPFLNMRQAFIDCKIGSKERAIGEIESLIPWFEEKLPSYLVIVYSYLGDAYLDKFMSLESILCYEKALEISKDLHSHRDFSIDIYEKLARVYFDQKEFEKAYQELEKAARLKALIFDSRSKYNQPLLEIQDEFRNAMEEKEQLIQENLIAQLEHENKERVLRMIIVSVFSFFLLLFGLFFYLNLRNRHRAEKKLIQLEIKNNRDLLELKNKELATSTLKLIEKEKLFLELKSRLEENKGVFDRKELNRFINALRTGNRNTWEAFETQFVSVNNGFFDKLKEKFPNLTQGEERLCALLKLKLHNKEIAGLMNISVESVHKSRYRLRKKLELEKNADLGSFIDSLI